MPLYRLVSSFFLFCLVLGAIVQTPAQKVSSPRSAPRSATQHYARARAYIADGEQEKALEELRLAIGAMPVFIEAHRDYQDLLQSKPEMLLREYGAYLEKYPKNAAYRYLFGRAYAVAGRRSEAEIEYQKTLAIDPNFSWALLSLGLIERDRGASEKAAEYLEKARAKAGNSVALHFSLASELLAVKRYPAAAAEAALVLRSDPTFFAAYPIKWRAQTNVSAGDKTFASITREIEQLEAAHPKDVTALEAAMQGCELLIDKPGMAAARNAILAIDPKYFEKKTYVKIYAMTAKRQLLEFTGPSAQRFYEAGSLSDPAQKLKVYLDVKNEVSDEDIELYLIDPAILTAQAELGKTAEAEETLARAEKGGVSDIALANRRVALASAYLKQKQGLDRALQLLETVETSQRKIIAEYENNGDAKNSTDFARTSLAKALYVRAQIEMFSGLRDKALASFIESVKQKESEDNTLELGLIYLRSGKVDDGIKLLAQAYSFEGHKDQEAKTALEQNYGEREKAQPLALFLKDAINGRRLETKRVLTYETSAMLSKAEAKPAPVFELTSVSGQKVSLADLKGKVVLINFWATWCGPCVKEWPSIQKIYGEKKDKGLVLVAISVDDEKFRVPLFLKKNPSEGLMLLSDGKIDRIYESIYGIPLILLVDKNGMIRYRKTAPGANDERILRQSIDSLLAEN
jgi:cytochrome c biogenesis protein CcmG, thiol:disulfide interchange protein DsbE